MPPKPTIAERAVLASGAGPAPVLDFVGAMALQAFFLAMRLGLVDLLADRPGAKASELAVRLDVDERGVELLLASLGAAGYVRERRGRWALTRMAAKWAPRLASGRPFYEHLAVEDWDAVERRVRGEGGGGVLHRSGEEEAEAQAGMLANARLAADELGWRVRLQRGARRLLDVGGGHGLYSVRFCHRHARLTATVVDRPEVLELTRRVAAEEGLGARIEARAADFWVDDLGAGYDVALVFNVLNAYDDESKVELLQRVASALSPGGMLVVVDGMRGHARRGLARAIVELTTLRMFDPDAPATYRREDLLGWLRRAGFAPRKTGALRSVPWVGFTTAVRSRRVNRGESRRDGNDQNRRNRGVVGVGDPRP